MKTIKLIIILLMIFKIPVSVFSQDRVDLLILNKKYNEALTRIDRKLEQDPSADLLLKKGLIYNRLQKYQDALNAYSAALQQDPSNIEVMEEMAETLSLLGNNQDAENFYKRALELDTTNLIIAGKLGRVYINQKLTKSAYKVFTNIYSKDSTNTYWNKQLAYCSYRVGRIKQAVYLYEKVLEANPRDYGSYVNLVHLYDKREDAKKITALLDSALVQFPDDAGMLLERANFFFRTKNYKSAKKAFDDYFNVGGDKIFDIEMNYGISCYFAPDIDKAMETFSRLYSAVPNDAIVMYYLSLCHKKLNNFEESEKMMRWAIDATVPDYVSEMYHHLGQILGQQRKFKESVEALKKSIELDPEKFEVLFEIATTYEEFNSNKTMALNYYRLYLEEAKESADNVNYALDRIKRIKEDLFFEE